MTPERCMCGATDCRRCYPSTWNTREPTERHYELALEEIVEGVLNHGQWPRKGRSRFDLYDFLLDRDTSFLLEMYVLAISSNTQSFEDRIDRERKHVEEMLIAHLRDSDIVQDLAEENAAEAE